MAFDKTIDARLWGVTNQASNVRMPIGDSSGGTFTSRANPLRGTKLWDICTYVATGVSVNGGATGGSWSLYIETDALSGVTGLPICGVSLGPGSVGSVILTNMHQSEGSPLPTHLNLIQHAGGTTGGLTIPSIQVVAKQYRGVLSTVSMLNSERVIEGTMLRVGTNSADATFTIGTSSSDLGLRKLRIWDKAFVWLVAGNSLSGTHDMHLIGRMPSSGATVTIARTGTGGQLAVAGGKRPLVNQHFGSCLSPTHLIWDVVSAGGISDARVIAIAKGGRGSMGKG